MSARPVLVALGRAYEDLAAEAAALDATTCWAPSGCLGWSARDLLHHLLGDAQRALVALAAPLAPGSAAPDRDAVTYWRDWSAGREDPDQRDLRAQRVLAATWGLEPLVATAARTWAAVVSLAGRTDPGDLVATQGHVLRAEDLLSTLVVEAAVHHLDLVVATGGEGPGAPALAEARRVLEGLLGAPAPGGLDDRTWVVLATGRRPPGPEEARALGEAAERLPLLG